MRVSPGSVVCEGDLLVLRESFKLDLRVSKPPPLIEAGRGEAKGEVYETLHVCIISVCKCVCVRYLYLKCNSSPSSPGSGY